MPMVAPTPMATVPTVAPAPVTVVPVAVPVVAPTHLFRLETIDLLLPNDRGFRVSAVGGLRH